MFLFHPFIWPLSLIGLSLLITFLTALDLPGQWRRRRQPRSATSGESQSSGKAKGGLPVSIRVVRNSGIFWFCAGIATLVHALTPVPWSRPGSLISTVVGLVWMAIGWRLFRSTFPRPVIPIQPGENGVQLSQIVIQLAERELATGQVGLVVGAIAETQEFLSGFGALQVGGTVPPDAETLFEIGSISKVFTSLLLAQAVEAGELNLDDRIADLLPEGWTMPELARAITLRHCTTHTSGLPRLPANLLSFLGGLQVLTLGSDPYRDYTEDQFRQALATVKLNRPPGTRIEYSNFGVGLLGFVLSRRHGMDYESFVIDRICRPLGMQETVITIDERTRHRIPSKYRLTIPLGPLKYGLTSDDWRIPNSLAGAGAIRSTGRDMLTFLKANMGLISTPFDGAILRAHQELFRDPTGMTIGMNWIRSFDDQLAQNIIWHNGGTGGFRTYLGFTENRQFGVFVLGNTAHAVDPLGVDLLKSFVRELGAGGRRD